MTNCGGRPNQMWIFILALLLLGSLAACADDSTPTPVPATPVAKVDPSTKISRSVENNLPVATPAPAPSPTPTTGTLVLWHSWAQAEGEALAQILTDFQHLYPGLTVETLFVAHDDLLQSYAQAVQSGGGPDLLLAPNWWLQEMVELGIAQSLEEVVLSEELAEYWPATLDSLRWNKVLYGLPTHFKLPSLYVNQAIAPPQGPPATTGDMLELARQNTIFGTGLYASLFHLYWGFPAFGAQLTDDGGRVILDHNDGAAAYLTWLTDLDEAQGSYVDLDYGMLLDRFKKGEFAFFVDGPWALPDLRGALGGNLSLAPLPSGPAGPARPWMYADGVFINPVSSLQQQRLALLLARHLTGPDAGSHMAQIAALLPADRQANLGHDPMLAAFVAQAATAEAMPTTAEMDQILGYGGDMIIRALGRTDEPAIIVAETAALINDATEKSTTP